MIDLVNDRYCLNIFSFLAANNKKIRFNKMYKQLNIFGAKMSKPTLIEHLKHLIEKDYILREKEDKQKVTYQINSKKFEKLYESIELKKTLNLQIKNREIFKSMSLKDQIAFVANLETMEALINLQLNVTSFLEPEAESINNFASVLIRRLYSNYRRWLLEYCKTSKEMSEKAYNLLGKGVKECNALLFDQIDETPKELNSASK